MRSNVHLIGYTDIGLVTITKYDKSNMNEQILYNKVTTDIREDRTHIYVTRCWAIDTCLLINKLSFDTIKSWYDKSIALNENIYQSTAEGTRYRAELKSRLPTIKQLIEKI